MMRDIRGTAMDEMDALCMAILADQIYNDALAADKAGLQDMCTANVEVTLAIQLEIARDQEQA